MNTKKTLRSRIRDMESRLNQTQDRFKQWGKGWRTLKPAQKDRKGETTLDALEMSVRKTGNNLRRLSLRLEHSIGKRKLPNDSFDGISQGRESSDKSRKGAKTSFHKPLSQEDRSTHNFLAESPEDWLDFLGTQQISLDDPQFPGSFKKDETDFYQKSMHRKTNTSVREVSETDVIIRNLMKDVEVLNAEVHLISGKNAELIKVIDSFKEGKDSISSLVFNTETRVMKTISELAAKLSIIETRLSAIETHILESLKDTLKQLREINEFARDTMSQMKTLNEARNSLESVLQQTKTWTKTQITDLEAELAVSRTENVALVSDLVENKASYAALLYRIQTLETAKTSDFQFSEQLETVQTALGIAEDRLRLQRVEIQELHKEISETAEKEERSRNREKELREEVWRLRLMLREACEEYRDLEEQSRTDTIQGQSEELQVYESGDSAYKEKVDNSEETSHYIADLNNSPAETQNGRGKSFLCEIKNL